MDPSATRVSTAFEKTSPLQHNFSDIMNLSALITGTSYHY